MTTEDRKVIFDGKQYYEAWRAQIVSGIGAQDELQSLIASPPTQVETEYVEFDPEQYAQRHRTHMRRQEAAKSYVYARLTLQVLNSVRRARTVREVLTILDDEYRPRSDAAASMARRRFYGERFRVGGDMVKYLRIFHDNAEQFETPGNTYQ